MTTVPIVFAFDNNLTMPAAVCIYSLLVNAKPSTAYDIYIIHRKNHQLDLSKVERVMEHFPQSTLTLREVGDVFDSSFEIRGITTPAYYRLLIPDLIPEHDRVIYSDVDVVFRQDLSEVYTSPLGDNILAGVNNLAHVDADLKAHYEGALGLNPHNIICSGFLVMDCAAMRRENLKDRFLELAKNRYKFQDQDILNITCAGRIKMLAPKYSLLTYISYYSITNGKESLEPLWTAAEVDEAMREGNVHYNGNKPWKNWCVNFDIWWEYYRKSPIFDQKYYFDFYYSRLNELDQLPLLKRIKILVRYFVYGRRKNP